MRRGTRLALILALIVAAVGLLGYAVHSLDIVGMIVSAHSPPQHGV
jgi:hypothetical protein